MLLIQLPQIRVDSDEEWRILGCIGQHPWQQVSSDLASSSKYLWWVAWYFNQYSNVFTHKTFFVVYDWLIYDWLFKKIFHTLVHHSFRLQSINHNISYIILWHKLEADINPECITYLDKGFNIEHLMKYLAQVVPNY